MATARQFRQPAAHGWTGGACDRHGAQATTAARPATALVEPSSGKHLLAGHGRTVGRARVARHEQLNRRTRWTIVTTTTLFLLPRLPRLVGGRPTPVPCTRKFAKTIQATARSAECTWCRSKVGQLLEAPPAIMIIRATATSTNTARRNLCRHPPMPIALRVRPPTCGPRQLRRRRLQDLPNPLCQARSTPVRCTRRFARITPAVAPSAG